MKLIGDRFTESEYYVPEESDLGKLFECIIVDERDWARDIKKGDREIVKVVTYEGENFASHQGYVFQVILSSNYEAGTLGLRNTAISEIKEIKDYENS